MKKTNNNLTDFGLQTSDSRLLLRLIAMLALQLAFVFFGTGLHAQEYNYSYPSGNPEYGQLKMRQYKVTDATPYNSSTDHTIDLKMDCLAANGYGQWTSSSAMGNLG